MSEHSIHPTGRILATVASLGLLVAAVGCDTQRPATTAGVEYVAPQTTTTEDGKHPIEPCFDHVLSSIPGQTDLDGPIYDPPLVVNAPNSQVDGDPKALSPELVASVTESVVVVESKLGTGTGFITKDAKGNSFVVTAAHVVAPGKVEDLKVLDDRRQTSSVTAACYVYENRTGLLEPKPHGSQDPEHDLAVLKLSQPLGQQTLNLNFDQPKRGQWVFFDNYQKDAQPPDIIAYTGLAISNPPVSNYQVATGIHGFPDEATATANKRFVKVQAGASGGPVLNQAGQVIGEVYASTDDSLGVDPVDMKVPYKVKFDGAVYGPTTGFEPTVAEITPSFYIQQALASPKLG